MTWASLNQRGLGDEVRLSLILQAGWIIVSAWGGVI